MKYNKAETPARPGGRKQPGQATGREGKKMRQYQVIAFNRATGAMDYTSELLTWQKCNQTYFDATKNYPNHEIVIVVNK